MLARDHVPLVATGLCGLTFVATPWPELVGDIQSSWGPHEASAELIYMADPVPHV